jgi:hypothetical protein
VGCLVVRVGAPSANEQSPPAFAALTPVGHGASTAEPVVLVNERRATAGCLGVPKVGATPMVPASEAPAGARMADLPGRRHGGSTTSQSKWPGVRGKAILSPFPPSSSAQGCKSATHAFLGDPMERRTSTDSTR